LSFSAFDPKATCQGNDVKIGPTHFDVPIAVSRHCFNDDLGLPMTLQGSVIGPRQGEHLVLRGGDIFINADPVGGCKGLAIGTQQVPVGVGIPIHRHFEMDEAFYVIEGRGTVILDDVRHPIEKGASIRVPKNTWHGFENHSDELILLWTVAPPGLEAFFREIAVRPGVQPTHRTKEQLNEIARGYGTEFR
jgi:quercetin dioxygenase-like cupin family protein